MKHFSFRHEIQKVLKKHQQFNKPTFIPSLQPVEPEDESAGWHRNEDDDDGLIRKGSGSDRVELSHDDDMMDDLDEMIFGKRRVEDCKGSTKKDLDNNYILVALRILKSYNPQPER
ncbi:hypothetical protein PIB30_005359 [Stylosanthes scabra]|uniref:Uncharacterized protein n=1 Tax=Stylosanthes scabra TaxID=79078 RepID=A0ABU6W2B1_9FABA|nr:hypothetical protein [Stylosanthes scabra]